MALPKSRATSEPSAADSSIDWRPLDHIESHDAVDAYIVRHPEIVALLGAAHQRIRTYFPRSGTPMLRVERDPGDGDEWLALLVPVAGDDDAARNSLRQFDEDWWLDAAPRGGPVGVIDITRR